MTGRGLGLAQPCRSGMSRALTRDWACMSPWQYESREEHGARASSDLLWTHPSNAQSSNAAATLIKIRREHLIWMCPSSSRLPHVPLRHYRSQCAQVADAHHGWAASGDLDEGERGVASASGGAGRREACGRGDGVGGEP